jgi:hypothetical protein
MERAMSEAPESVHVDERRLAAILAADVAGYSRLMGRNEDETVRDLEAHKAAILPLIARHGGSIINIAGDGIVAQFPSAVRAVECAVAMQTIMRERNVDASKERINTAWTNYLAGRYGEALEALKGVEATHPWPLMVVYVRLGQIDEAKSLTAEYLKSGPHSILSESCTPIREPMKQRYLGDLRKAGFPERAERASP